MTSATGESIAAIDLTILIQPPDDDAHLQVLLPQLTALVERLGIRYEILLLRVSPARPAPVAGVPRMRVIETPPAYGVALSIGFAHAAGAYVLTMDPDLSHPPHVVERLWRERDAADVVIASRYVPGGRAEMPLYRRAGSRLVNALFSRGLDVPIRDLSSGFRLYRAATIDGQQITSRDFDILQQTVVQAFAEGWRVAEIPFEYVPHRNAGAAGRSLRVAAAWLRTFGQLWLLRNSILAADYDYRAHNSRIPLQRYWQRARFGHVLDLVAGEGPVLDVGCGSSRIIGNLPAGSVAIDVLQRKLRFARRFERPLVRASGFALPFRDASFPCVLCSQVIEHVPKESPILDELCRVLQPGGRLVLGTPDYANWQWVYMEKVYGLVPGGYRDEHISHYTNAELVRVIGERGLRFEEERYILRGELIQAFRKPRGSG
jgi:dolichol-phosphate mannosyltransferase